MAAQRRVRRLQLRAPSEDEAQRGATLLEDALATASMPGTAGGRLIVIRRLTLGRIRTDVSAASLALHVAETTRHTLCEAVPFDDPAAATAVAVVFPGRADALIALARVHARRQPASAWFWTSALPGWSAIRSREERWRRLVDTASVEPEGAVLSMAIVREAVAAGVADELLESISRTDAMRWMQRAGWTADAPVDAGLVCGRIADRAGTLARWQMRWSPSDPRLIWCGAMIAVDENTLRAADPQLPARIAAMLAAAATRATRRPAAAADSMAAPAADASMRPSVSSRPVTGRAVDGATPLSTEATVEWRPADSPAASDAAAASAYAPDSPAPGEFSRAGAAGELPTGAAGDALFTDFGGLLFAVPILQRLGFAAYLAGHPRLLHEGYPLRLLSYIGRRAGLDSRDPFARSWLARSWLPPSGGRTHGCAEHDAHGSAEIPAAAIDLMELPAPARWLLSAPAPRGACSSPFWLWTAAVRRWCRRHPRLGLIALIRRPARLHLSATHVQVTFRMSELDIRLRRLAIDVDPGWVPWLGRVVSYQYED